MTQAPASDSGVGMAKGGPALRLAALANSGIEGEESVLCERRPGKASVLLQSAGTLSVLLMVCVLGLVLVASAIAPVIGTWLCLLSVVAAILKLSCEAVRRDARRYALTSRRVMARSGVFRRDVVEAPLHTLQSVVMSRSILERLLGLGTIGMTTAGIGPEVVWWHVEGPEAVHQQVREAIDRYAESAARHAMAHSYASRSTDGRSTMPVIGLAGGIGSGKSTVAAAFARLGCHVIDSDQRVREALDRPEVRERLVEWWGSRVLNTMGRIDRSKVADIIFQDPAQRARLEGLVHPIVRQERARMIDEAARFWARAVIVDAPLLFEAGVDSECDAVVFVDAPRAERLRRVNTRGWTEAEFDRRESAQLSLEEKRSRSQFVVQNSGSTADIDTQVSWILEQVRERTG